MILTRTKEIEMNKTSSSLWNIQYKIAFFVLFLVGAMFSVVSVWLFLVAHLIAGVVAYQNLGRPNAFRSWNMPKTGALSACSTLGFAALAAVAWRR